MKKFNLILMLAGGLCILNLPSLAQNNNSGIYMTAADFQEGKLMYSATYKTKKHKIKLNDFFNKPYLYVKHNDSTIKLFKKDIFGYRFSNGEIYRTKEKREYKILNYGESTIILYRRNISRPPAGRTNVTNYYFSKDVFSPVQKLTFENLKAAFPNKNKFHEQLKARLKYNTDLALFDNIHKMYLINWIYQNTKTN